jgi:hypothetical protein
MPCLEAEPESWQTGGGGGLGGTTAVSSDLCGSKPRPPSVRQGRAVTREKWAPTEHRPPRFSIGASAPHSLGYWGDDLRVVRFSRGEAVPHS